MQSVLKEQAQPHLQGRPACYPFFWILVGYPPSNLSWGRGRCASQGTCPHPLFSASLHTYPDPPQSYSERARWGQRTHSSPSRGGPEFSGDEVGKGWPDS